MSAEDTIKIYQSILHGIPAEECPIPLTTQKLKDKWIRIKQEIDFVRFKNPDAVFVIPTEHPEVEQDLGKGLILKYDPDQPRDEGGRWTNAGFSAGGSGLTMRQMNELNKKYDPQKKSLYRAEGKYAKETRARQKFTEPKPVFGKHRFDFSSNEEYEKAYKEYSKKFDEWALKYNEVIQSDTGLKFLDGTKNGVANYVDNVINSDWFIEKFGDGGLMGQPEIGTTVKQGIGGRWQYSVKGGDGEDEISQKLVIQKNYLSNEQIILHEISHYATAISQTTPFEGHGVEFANNHVSIVENVVGSNAADVLKERYREEGVKFGD